MRLSEAIALGRNVTELNSGVWLSTSQDCGCLLGIGFMATGKATEYRDVATIGREELASEWPWIEELRAFPHNLLPQWTLLRCCAVGIISQLAAAVQRKQVTFDQAIDWIRENEPQETAEEKRDIVEQFCEQIVEQR